MTQSKEYILSYEDRNIVGAMQKWDMKTSDSDLFFR